MLPTYRRFKELKSKAMEELKEYGQIEEQLTNAVFEISLMNENDVPEHKWSQVQSIINSCLKHKAEGDEGHFRASINKMTYEEKKKLKNAITLL